MLLSHRYCHSQDFQRANSGPDRASGNEAAPLPRPNPWYPLVKGRLNYCRTLRTYFLQPAQHFLSILCFALRTSQVEHDPTAICRPKLCDIMGRPILKICAMKGCDVTDCYEHTGESFSVQSCLAKGVQLDAESQVRLICVHHRVLLCGNFLAA